jgi:PTH1 family peptidyl-tRNA hydrolase
MRENKAILIVGLGNPGNEYFGTRHNAGFMAIDQLAGGDASWKKEKNSLLSATTVCGHKIMFAKPQTYMNNSGVAVQAIMAFYKIPLENLAVIHDDMDLPVGDVREKLGGGSAGHNGIKSIDNAVGRDYLRIRIGIGHPRDFGSKIDPADWVLGKFSLDDMKKISAAIDTIKISDQC